MSATATAPRVKERPILFFGPMVRAILEGRKTQTRRVVNPQPLSVEVDDETFERDHGNGEHSMLIGYAGCPDGFRPMRWFRFDPKTSARLEYVRPAVNEKPSTAQVRREMDRRRLYGGGDKWAENEVLGLCPYGKAGDRLWVRETFVLEQQVNGNNPPHSDGRPVMRNNDVDAEWDWLQPHYRATDKTPELSCDGPPHKCDGREPCCHWQPSIFMPRWASRITLGVVNVRVERLQEISEADAVAEGTRQLRDGSGTYAGREGPGNLVSPWPTAKEAFADLWDTMNAKRGYSWDSNPFVWVIDLKKL